MNIVLEILYAIAAVATIGSFLHDLWTDYKEHGRSREGSRVIGQNVCPQSYAFPR